MLAAYDHRCAISNLPDDHFLDAAHIMADAHELLGRPVPPLGDDGTGAAGRKEP